MMGISFFKLIMSAKPKVHMNEPWYPYVFVLCLIAFIEGLLFAFFTYEMVTEQLESIESNQSYVDDLKN